MPICQFNISYRPLWTIWLMCSMWCQQRLDILRWLICPYSRKMIT